MFERIRTRKRIANEALAREFPEAGEQLCYNSVRNELIHFLIETAGEGIDTSRVVGYQRQVLIGGEDGVFHLTVDTRKDERGEYGKLAGNLSLAVINVTLEDEDGGKETISVYPLRWFLEHDPMYLSIEVKKTVFDLAEIVGFLRRGDYL